MSLPVAVTISGIYSLDVLHQNLGVARGFKIRANAKHTAFAGKLGDVWKLHVAAPPVDGKANDALVRFLAKLTGRPVSAVRIVSGFGSPIRTVEIDGVDSQELDRAILESHGPETHTGIA